MSLYLALKINDRDNVATVFSEGIVLDSEMEVRDKHGKSEKIQALEAIPYGHKIALRDIRRGEQIYKYGESIGIATKDIWKGEYVHVHNLDSMRGRGDLKEGIAK